MLFIRCIYIVFFFFSSDIKPGKNIENISRQVDLLLPEVPVERSEPLFNIVKNPFTQHSLNNGYVTSQTYFSDGASNHLSHYIILKVDLMYRG